MYGFLRRVICIAVSHILGMKMEVIFFTCSIAACIAAFMFDDFNFGHCVHGIQQSRSGELIPVLAGAAIKEWDDMFN